MGQSPSGILAYGYDLGNSEDWEFSLPNGDDDDFIDIEKVEQILLAQIVGFTETWETGKADYYVREKEAKEKLGVEFVRYGSWDYAGYIIATQVHVAIDWGSIEIEISLDHSAAERLDRALKILGIVPNQSEPKWILASFYG